jgi:hypothetical protein
MTTKNFNVKNGLTTGAITLDGLTGNITSTNADLGNLAVANYFRGDGSLLSNINAGNIGTVSTANYAAYAGNVITANQPLITSVGTLTSLTVGNNTSNTQFGNGTINATGTITGGFIAGDGSLLTNITGANVTGTVSNATTAVVAGTVTTAAQPNITSVGTLTSLTVTNTTQTGTAKIDNLTSTRVPFANAGSYLVDSSDLTFTTGTGTLTAANLQVNTNASVGTLSATNVSSNLVPTGNGTVSLGSSTNRWKDLYVSGSSIYIGGTTITDAAGVLTTADANITGTLTASLLTGTLTTAAQPNITSVGTLSSLAVTANANVGGLKTDNLYYANGTPWSFSSPGGATNDIQYKDGSSFAGSSNFTFDPAANLLYVNGTANVNVLNVLNGPSQFNGNLNINGNINATGNLNYENVTDLVIGDPLIYIGANNTSSDSVDLGFIVSFNNGTYQHGGFVRDHTDDTWKLFANVIAEPTTTVDFANAVLAPIDVGALNATSVTSAGTISGGLLTGTLTTAAQPNVTSVGTLSGLTSTGTIDFGGASNVTLGSNAIVHISGGSSGYLLTTDGSGTLSWTAPAGGGGIAGSNTQVQFNDNGSFAASSDFTFNKGTNTLSVTNLSINNSGAISGANSVSATYFVGNGALLTSITGASVTGTVANATYATSAGSADTATTATSATTAGTVTTSAQPNITSVGTLTSLSSSGDISASNFIGNGYQLTGINGANVLGTVANATYATSAGSAGTATSATTAGTVTTAAQPNITSVGTLTSLTSSGNISASYFIGNGSTLGSITGANVTGTVANATYALTSGTADSATTAGTVTTAAQPNITSVGTLTSVSSSGDITSSTYVKAKGFTDNRTAITVTTATLIDEFPPATFRGAKYTIKGGSTNGYQISDVLLVHNDTDAFITINNVCSNPTADIFDVTANVNGTSGNVTVYATRVAAVTTTVNLSTIYVKD